MKKIMFLLLVFISCNILSQTFYNPEPLTHTYSIVAIDPETGDMGVAVQSHWFSVGTVVAWGEAGVGVVATQSFVNVSFGIRGLELLKKGYSPEETVKLLLHDDEAREVRQLAVLDAKGRVAVHTGTNCIPEAGHIKGSGFSVQANMMLSNKVWPAMASAFERSKGPLAERMLSALEAAQLEGGDIRGQQSAVLLVVRAKSTGKVWEDKLVDLRIDDHPTPLLELKRLLKVHRAYEHMNNGDLAVEVNDMELAMKEYSAAEKMFPENEEMKFWHAVTLANIGKIEESLPIFHTVFEINHNWVILLKRLPGVGLLTVNETDLKLILNDFEKE